MDKGPIQSLTEECRDGLARAVVDRANAVMRLAFQEDTEKGMVALSHCVSSVTPEESLQLAIIQRIVFRPPYFMLAKDNQLRQGAVAMARVLTKARAAVGLSFTPEREQLLAEIDKALLDAGMKDG